MADDDDTIYIDGNTLTVPEATAQDWERNGWVRRVTGK